MRVEEGRQILGDKNQDGEVKEQNDRKRTVNDHSPEANIIKERLNKIKKTEKNTRTSMIMTRVK